MANKSVEEYIELIEIERQSSSAGLWILKAILDYPDNPDILIFYGLHLINNLKLDQAEEILSKVGSLSSKQNLQNLYFKKGQVQKGLDLLPVSKSNITLFGSLYNCSNKKLITKNSNAYVKGIKPMKIYPKDWPFSGGKNIAFVSGDYYKHPVSHFLTFLNELSNLLINDSRELVLLNTKGHDYDNHLINLNHHFVGKDPQLLLDALRIWQIGTIIDLSGYTAHSITDILRDISLAAELQDVDIKLYSYLGYPVEIPGFTYIEQDTLLNGHFPFMYSPLISNEEAPIIVKTDPNVFTFGLYCRLEKITDDYLLIVDEYLSEIRQMVDLTDQKIKLIIKCSVFYLKSEAQAFVDRLNLIKFKNIDLLQLQGSETNKWDTFNKIDCMLDPFPYCGVTMSCDALYMGVPIYIITQNWNSHKYTTVTKRLIDYIDHLGCYDSFNLTMLELARLGKSQIFRNKLRSKFLTKMDHNKLAHNFYCILSNKPIEDRRYYGTGLWLTQALTTISEEGEDLDNNYQNII